MVSNGCASCRQVLGNYRFRLDVLSVVELVVRFLTTQRAQYPLNKEYTLNYKGLDYDLRYIP